MKYARQAVFVFLFLFGLVGLSQAQDQSMPYYNAGNSYYSQQNYDQAIRYYQAAVQANPNMWQAYQGLGNCNYAKGDKANALTNYQKALSINPNNPSLSQFVQTLQPQSTPPLPASNAAAPSNDSAANPSAAPSGASIDPNLPQQGKIVFEIEDSDWLGSWADLQKYYNNAITSSDTPFGAKLGLGAAYALSPNFQLGAKLQFLLKKPESLVASGETVTYNETALGGAVEAEGVFPMGGGVNFVSGLQAGFYTLVGNTITGTGAINGTANISGTAPGGMITAGVEFLMDPKKTWALDLGLAYQFLSFSPLTDTPTVNGQTGSSFTLRNPSDGSNAYFDFSGVGLEAAARFF